MSKYQEKNVERNRSEILQEAKEKYPDLFKAIFDEGYNAGRGSVNFQVDDLDHIESQPISVEQHAKATWDQDPNIRQEFENDFAAYDALCRAESKGLVKILSG